MASKLKGGTVIMVGSRFSIVAKRKKEKNHLLRRCVVILIFFFHPAEWRRYNKASFAQNGETDSALPEQLGDLKFLRLESKRLP